MLPLLLLAAASAQTLDDCPDAACAADRGRELLDHARDEEALALLKEARRRWPDDEQVTVLLGIAYYLDGNHYWSIRTLDTWVQAHPDDCEARTWLAWAQLHLRALDAAAAALDSETCRTGQGPATTRFLLQRAAVAWTLNQEDVALSELHLASAQPRAWTEDRAALAAVRRALDPTATDELTWRLDAEGGWTSDVRMGSPFILKEVPGPASPRLEASGWLQWAPDWTVRPTAELQPRLTWVTAPDLAEYSSLDLQARAGALLGHAHPRALVGVRGIEFVQLRPYRSDPPRSYYQALRGEVDAELSPMWVAFAGSGRRVFLEGARTRWEVDGGGGWQGQLGQRLVLMGAATGRLYRATNPQWHQWGMGGTATARLRLGEWQLWPAFTLSFDSFPQWPALARQDLVLRPALVAWTPTRAGLRAGVELSWTGERSTDDLYDLDEVRAVVRLRWGGAANPGLPGPADTAPVYPFDWGFDTSLGISDERVQDLVRQDEQVQGGCGCAQ